MPQDKPLVSLQKTPFHKYSYTSNLRTFAGTVFLWLFWPSFNAALAEGNAQHRAVVNTYLSMAGSAVIVFAISALVDRKDRIDMEHVQNATLAGGVAIGASADMMLRPWAALTIGSVAGLISTLGYKYLTVSGGGVGGVGWCGWGLGEGVRGEGKVGRILLRKVYGKYDDSVSSKNMYRRSTFSPIHHWWLLLF